MNLRPLFKASALLVAAAAVVAILLNLAVFGAWSLDYLQVASAGDVAMAVAGTLMRALPGVALIALGLFWTGPRRRAGATAVLCLLGLAAFAVLVGRPAWIAAEKGFYAKGDWVIDGGTGGCAVAKVMWTGQNAVVYQCVATGARRFRVSFDRGSMTLLPAAQVGELVNRM